MKTLIASMLVVAAGSAMACPGEKSADAAAAAPAPMVAKESASTKVARNAGAVKSQVVAKAAVSTTTAR